MATSAADVAQIYQLLLENGIKIWIVGGWGIDALLGEQTRDHKDLDVLILLDDVQQTCELVAHHGYQLKELWIENEWAIDAQANKVATAFVLQDAEGREFDAHAMTLDEQGNGIPAWEANDFFFTKEDLSGTGTIVGIPVQCITPKSQIESHTGYELPDEQIRDMELLRKKFDVRD